MFSESVYSTSGFTMVPDGMKAYPEHVIRLNLIDGKLPGNILSWVPVLHKR